MYCPEAKYGFCIFIKPQSPDFCVASNPRNIFRMGNKRLPENNIKFHIIMRHMR